MGLIKAVVDMIETPARVIDAIVPPHTKSDDVKVIKTDTFTKS